ncbi:MAG: STAS domain-containing protein [Saprospiraceae bacterium]|jgi:anti-sigma B factor antagonist|uniref:STAS domain-containing protein n=1 Tax=Candidatus Brachybacter algidus TaxID=2982024 RepID=UPI001B6CBD4A|nr:STAS domain-containing protein [Candidatus Brachybacter algidus]MBP7307623.1 STAS domain-containing protein [Saprospiraceae bacterium]MBK7602653.1 STAS domain-containing protein [Candidatus Brachybacter algidus]MBK8354691.1 STAS domain-containing protein [Candidatus Brachybacter algidus]MBK8602321.1 STAS domain-containing protein [Candidatus Brachybacter algidus]MBK8746875.1 STAS domain-containing protein [Candidatus Brachybacter algidus]
MKYSIDKQDHYAIMTLEEENLNSILAPDLKSELVIFKNEGLTNLVISLAKVKYIDSSGLSAILTGNRLWKENGSFILTEINHASVKKLIEISRLESILTIIPTIEESLDYVLMDEIEKELNASTEEE